MNREVTVVKPPAVKYALPRTPILLLYQVILRATLRLGQPAPKPPASARRWTRTQKATARPSPGGRKARGTCFLVQGCSITDVVARVSRGKTGLQPGEEDGPLGIPRPAGGDSPLTPVRDALSWLLESVQPRRTDRRARCARPVRKKVAASTRRRWAPLRAWAPTGYPYVLAGASAVP